METKQPSYRHENCRIYRLVESSSKSVDHLHELGIEAKQVELSPGEEKLQFDPSFSEPQHFDLHETYPLKEDKDDPQTIPELTFVPSWDRCLRRAADQMAHWVSVGYRSSKQSESDEEGLFCCARYLYTCEIRDACPDLWIDSAQDTLLHMEALLRAWRDRVLGPPQAGFAPCFLSDLSPLSCRWRTRAGKGNPELAGLHGPPTDVRWRIEDVVEDLTLKDPLPHAVLWNWVEFAAGIAP